MPTLNQSRFAIIFWIMFLILTACQSSETDSFSDTGSSGPGCDCSPADVLFPYQRVADFDAVDYHEPSGMVYHPERNSFFVVGDQGHLTEIAPDGTPLKQKLVAEADFEGLALNPDNGLLYAVIENKDSLFEIDPESLETRRNIALDLTYENEPLVAGDKHGIEGITFVPDSSRDDGGTFYLANQSLQSGDNAASLIIELNVDSSAGVPIGRTARFFSVPLTDLSDLAYDPGSGTLLAISDRNNVLLRLTLSGEIIEVFPLPGQDQEAVTLDAQGALFIGEDSGHVIKFELK